MPRPNLAESPVESALRSLESVAHAVAAGRADRAPVEELLGALGAVAPRRTALLGILGDTARRIDDPLARRKFFHAARAYVSLQRGWLADRAA